MSGLLKCGGINKKFSSGYKISSCFKVKVSKHRAIFQRIVLLVLTKKVSPIGAVLINELNNELNCYSEVHVVGSQLSIPNLFA